MQKQEQMNHLKKYYPSLAIYIFKHYRRIDLAYKYQNECKEYENDSFKYCYYVHGWLIPWLRQKKSEGKLKHGR